MSRSLDFSVAAQDCTHQTSFHLDFDGDNNENMPRAESRLEAGAKAAEALRKKKDDQLRRAAVALDSLRQIRSDAIERRNIAAQTGSKTMRHYIGEMRNLVSAPRASSSASLPEGKEGGGDEEKGLQVAIPQVTRMPKPKPKKKKSTLSFFFGSETTDSGLMSHRSGGSHRPPRVPGGPGRRPRKVPEPPRLITNVDPVDWSDVDNNYGVLAVERRLRRAAKAETQATGQAEGPDVVRVCPTKTVTPQINKEMDREISKADDGAVRFPCAGATSRQVLFTPQVQMWEPFVAAAILSVPHYVITNETEDDVYDKYRAEEAREAEDAARKEQDKANGVPPEESAGSAREGKDGAEGKEQSDKQEHGLAQWHIRHCIKLFEHTEKSMRRTLPMSVLRVHVAHPGLTGKEPKLVQFLNLFLEKKFEPLTFGAQKLQAYIGDSLFNTEMTPDRRTPRAYMVAPHALQLIRDVPGSFYETQYPEMLAAMNAAGIAAYNVDKLVDHHVNVASLNEWAAAFDKPPPEIDYEVVQAYTDPGMIRKKHGGFSLGHEEVPLTRESEQMSHKVGLTLEQLLVQAAESLEVDEGSQLGGPQGKHTPKRKRILINPEDPCYMPFGLTLTEAFLLIRSLFMPLPKVIPPGMVPQEVKKKRMGKSSRDRHMLAAAILTDLYMREKIDVNSWQLSALLGDATPPEVGAKEVTSYTYRVSAPPHAPMWTTQVIHKKTKKPVGHHWLEHYIHHAHDIFDCMEVPHHYEDYVWTSLDERGVMKPVWEWTQKRFSKLTTRARGCSFNWRRCVRRCKCRRRSASEDKDKTGADVGKLEFAAPATRLSLIPAVARHVEELHHRRLAAKGHNFQVEESEPSDTASEKSSVSGKSSKSSRRRKAKKPKVNKPTPMPLDKVSCIYEEVKAKARNTVTSEMKELKALTAEGEDPEGKGKKQADEKTSEAATDQSEEAVDQEKHERPANRPSVSSAVSTTQIANRDSWWEELKVLYVNAYHLQVDQLSFHDEQEQDVGIWRAQLLFFFWALQLLFEHAFEAKNAFEVVFQTFCPPFAKLPLAPPPGLEASAAVIRGFVHRARMIGESRMDEGGGGSLAIEAGEYQEVNRDIITKELFGSPDLEDLLDEDGSGDTTLDEFIAGLRRIVENMKEKVFDHMHVKDVGTTIENLAIEIFADLDLDGNGSLTKEELREGIAERHKLAEDSIARGSPLLTMMSDQYEDFLKSLPWTEAHRKSVAFDKMRLMKIQRDYERRIQERIRELEIERNAGFDHESSSGEESIHDVG